MSKILISEVPTPWNSRTGPMKRLKDRSDVPKAGLGTLPKTCSNTKKKTRVRSTRWRKNESSGLRKQKCRRKESLWLIQERVCIWAVQKDFNSAELETMRTSRSPATVMTANGEVRTKEEATVYVMQWDLLVKVMFLAVLSLGKLCEDHGYT